jgi:RNA polymerase sigma-70 factor (ECF subfamily)
METTRCRGNLRYVDTPLLQLPMNHREIIIMSHFQEMSYKQIAELLDVPMGTVMSRLHNARKALRAKLTGNKP